MTWTLTHSLLMTALALLSWAAGNSAVAATGGVLSLAVFVYLRRSEWSPHGAFGAGNAVTAVRAALIVLLAALPGAGPVSAALALGIFCLDGVDGWLARRGPGSSVFGATFDMETDALLVLVAGLKLQTTGRLGPWILVPGLMRYVYAVAISLLPASHGEAPRSQLARFVFAIVIVSFVMSLWPVHPLHSWFAALATILLVVSFARSAFWSFCPRFQRLA
jgi:phosphatidylglycerophosphate synthase